MLCDTTRSSSKYELVSTLVAVTARSSALRNCLQRWAVRAFPSARFTASSSTHLATASARFRQKQDDKEETSSGIPAAIASLTVPFLVSSFLSDREKDRDFLPKPFPTVQCADATVPPKSHLPPERLAAIKSLDVVADVVEDVAPAVVSLTSSGNFLQLVSSTGSGFIVDDTGLIITNAHVVGHKQGLKVNMLDGRTFDARVLAVDVTSDLALVQIEADPDTVSKLPRMRLAPSSHDIRPGQFVIALGSPLMLSNTVTVGVISAVERDLGHREGLKYLQTDAIITFGNSGGPLVSLYGEVIGVNSMIADTGLGFAVPVDQVHRFIETSKRALANRGRGSSTPQPIGPPTATPQAPRSRSWSWSWSSSPRESDRAQGSVVVGPSGEHSRYLGLVMRTLTPDLAFDLAMRDPFGRFTNRDVQSGVLIHGVIRGSPAERAGLLPGDIIVAIDGKQITNAAEVSAAVDRSETLSLTVVRRGKRLDIPNVSTEAV
ncbi:Serine protease htra2, mitochondrial [Sparganum proliferum]